MGDITDFNVAVLFPNSSFLLDIDLSENSQTAVNRSIFSSQMQDISQNIPIPKPRDVQENDIEGAELTRIRVYRWDIIATASLMSNYFLSHSSIDSPFDLLHTSTLTLDALMKALKDSIFIFLLKYLTFGHVLGSISNCRKSSM